MDKEKYLKEKLAEYQEFVVNQVRMCHKIDFHNQEVNMI